MLDPITAFAAAQAAIKGVKAAIQMGKDINILLVLSIVAGVLLISLLAWGTMEYVAFMKA